MEQTAKQPLFPLAQIVATPAARAAIEKAEQGPPEFLGRHARGDWGDLCKRDRQENQFNVECGFPIFSSYRTDAGDERWVITDR